jgi:hypothetical protein
MAKGFGHIIQFYPWETTRKGRFLIYGGFLEKFIHPNFWLRRKRTTGEPQTRSARRASRW